MLLDLRLWCWQACTLARCVRYWLCEIKIISQLTSAWAVASLVSWGLAYLPAAGPAWLPQNIPKFLQVALDCSGDLHRRIETGPWPNWVRLSPSIISEGRGDPDSARSLPGARVGAPSGPSREPPPTAVRHFTLCLPVRGSGNSVGVTRNLHFQKSDTTLNTKLWSIHVLGWEKCSPDYEFLHALVPKYSC